MRIYSITGVLVKQFEETYTDNGYRIGPINWNGKDEYGGKLVQVCILQNWMFILMMEILHQNLSELY